MRQLMREDGSETRVKFIYSWSHNPEMWEYQLLALSKRNMRCVPYDRKSSGKSDRARQNYDYDTLADDLNQLIIELNLRKLVLPGFRWAEAKLPDKLESMAQSTKHYV